MPGEAGMGGMPPMEPGSSPSGLPGGPQNNISDEAEKSTAASEEGTEGAEGAAGKDGSGGESGGKSGKKGKNDLKKAKKAGEAVSGGANAAQQGIHAVNALNNIKNMLMMLSTVGQAASSGIVGAIASAANAVASFFTSIVSTVASAIGVGVTAAAAISIAGVITVIAAAAGVISEYVVSNDAGRYDDGVNCAEEIKKELETIEVVDGNAQKMYNAKCIYSVLHELGIPDINIAGFLGNCDEEGGIDPTAVESIYDEPYIIGPRKQAAIACGFDIEKIYPGYNAEVGAIVKLAGLGLFGFSDTLDGATNNTQLRAFADALGKNWYDLDTQLIFSLTPTAQGGYGRADWFRAWTEPEDSIYDAMYACASHLVGNTSLGMDIRLQKTTLWYNTIGGWSVDTAYANSVISLIGSVQATAGDSSMKKKMDECSDADGTYDNSSIVAAALSLAWPTEEEGQGNDGTPLYRHIKSLIMPGDTIFQSCDRSVATAVRWAGVDDDFPMGGCESNILPHLLASPKWEEVPWDNDKSKLQPGDVLVYPEHVILYVGEEAVKAKYPDDTGRSVYSGSINYSDVSNGRSPGLGFWYSGYETNGYHAFRSIYKEPNPKYKHLTLSSSSVTEPPVGGQDNP